MFLLPLQSDLFCCAFNPGHHSASIHSALGISVCPTTVMCVHLAWMPRAFLPFFLPPGQGRLRLVHYFRYWLKNFHISSPVSMSAWKVLWPAPITS